MSTQATRDYQRAQVALRAITYAETSLLWRLLDPDDLDGSFPRFATAAVVLIEVRREVSAALARQYLVESRAGVPGSMPVIATPQLDRVAALVSLRVTSAVSIKAAMTRRDSVSLATRNALVRTLGVVDRLVGDAGRELIRTSVEADPEARGWVRVTLGTCSFCASQAAGDHMQSGTANFPRHDHCGCQPEPQYQAAAPDSPERLEHAG